MRKLATILLLLAVLGLSFIGSTQHVLADTCVTGETAPGEVKDGCCVVKHMYMYCSGSNIYMTWDTYECYCCPVID